MWSIYSIGDSYFLAKIFNAVAMIFNSHIPDALAAIALTLGIFYQAFRGISQSIGLSFSQIFAVLIIYLCFFIPKAQVQIIDVYTDKVRVVENVPLGSAAAGSIISTIGFKVSNSFNKAFGEVHRDNNGFASSLVILAKLRETLSLVLKNKDIINANNGDFYSSWQNYIKECTLVGIDLGILKPQEIYSSENIFKALRFDSSLYGTQINIDGQKQNLTCTQSYDLLSNYTKGNFLVELNNTLNNISDKNNDRDELRLNQITEVSIDNALDTLGLSQTKGQDYILGSILLPIYEESVKAKYNNEHAYNMALMVEDAIRARNTQWSGEQSMFFTLVRPFITFFEGLVFALTPLMAFIVCLGIGGFSMLGKYLALLIWIELWQPLLTIINLYIIEAVKGNFEVMEVSGSSFSGIIESSQIISDYLAIGGMLSAGVPALSLMIVYGGIVAASSFAGRMNGQDHLNETIASPSLLNSNQVVSQMPKFSQGAISGIYKNGGLGLVPELNLSSVGSEALSKARGEAQASEQSFSDNLSNSQTHLLSDNLSNSYLRSMGSRISTSQSKSSQIINSKARSISKNLGLNEGEEEALKGAISGVLGGAKVNPLNLAQASLSHQKGSQSSKLQSKLSQALTGLSNNTSLKEDYQRALSDDYAKGIESTIMEGRTQQESNTLVESAKLASTQRRELGFLEQSVSQVGVTRSIDSGAITKMASSNEPLLKSMDNYSLSRDDIAKRTNELEPLMRSIFPNHKQAHAASLLTAMAEKDPKKAYEFMLRSIGEESFQHDDPNIKTPHMDSDFKRVNQDYFFSRPKTSFNDPENK